MYNWNFMFYRQLHVFDIEKFSLKKKVWHKGKALPIIFVFLEKTILSQKKNFECRHYILVLKLWINFKIKRKLFVPSSFFFFLYYNFMAYEKYQNFPVVIEVFQDNNKKKNTQTMYFSWNTFTITLKGTLLIFASKCVALFIYIYRRSIIAIYFH